MTVCLIAVEMFCFSSSVVWDPGQDTIWLCEERGGWNRQTAEWKGLLSRLPTARGQSVCLQQQIITVTFLYGNVWTQKLWPQHSADILLYLMSTGLFVYLSVCLYHCLSLSTGCIPAPVLSSVPPVSGSKADPVCLLGPVVLLEMLPASGPHQGVFWGENSPLLCLVG